MIAKKRYYSKAEKESFANGCRVGARNVKKSRAKRSYRKKSY